MRFIHFKVFTAGTVALTLATLICGGQGVEQQEVPANAAAIRKALNDTITLDYTAQSANDALEHLRQKTRLNIVIDNVLAVPPGLPAGLAGVMAFGGFPGGMQPAQGPIVLKSERGKVSAVLQSFINQAQKYVNRNNLTYIIMRDCVLISTEEAGYQRQLQQRVNVDVRQTPLSEVLRHLVDETGANLLIDPQLGERTRVGVTLKLENVTLDTAVRLLTQQADLGPARVGNILYVTSEARADKLRTENLAHANATDPTGGMGIGAPAGGFGGMGMPVVGGFAGGAIAAPVAAPPPLPPMAVPVEKAKILDKKDSDKK
jgi:hypothetical protein